MRGRVVSRRLGVRSYPLSSGLEVLWIRRPLRCCANVILTGHASALKVGGKGHYLRGYNRPNTVLDKPRGGFVVGSEWLEADQYRESLL